MEIYSVVILHTLIWICFLMLFTGVRKYFSTEEGAELASARAFQALGTVGVLALLIIEFVLNQADKGGAP